MKTPDACIIYSGLLWLKLGSRKAIWRVNMAGVMRRLLRNLFNGIQSAGWFVKSMISTIIDQEKVPFMLYRETMSAPVLTRSLRHLVRDAGYKAFLIFISISGVSLY